MLFCRGKTKLMRIFHLVPNLNYGGLQKVVQLLAMCQIRSGHMVTIGCWTHRCNHPEAEAELEAAGVRVVYLRRGADGEMSHGKLDSVKKLMSHLGTGREDILHIHNPFGYYIYGAIAGVASGTKTINTIHATAMFQHPKFGRKGNVLTWVSAQLTEGVISVCDEMDVYLRDRFRLSPTKYFVVENGIDLKEFLAVPDRVRRDDLVFGSAGRMAPEKNYGVLIEAFALARRKHSNIRLRILGSGGLEEQLTEQVRSLGMEHAIELCGFGNDVPGFLGSLDFYILSSRTEAHPLSLIEAIASGLPVIATTVGGVPTMVKKTNCGWLVEPNDPVALLAGIELAIVAPDRTEITARARELATELYSAERMAADYEAVYRRLLH